MILRRTTGARVLWTKGARGARGLCAAGLLASLVGLVQCESLEEKLVVVPANGSGAAPGSTPSPLDAALGEGCAGAGQSACAGAGQPQRLICQGGVWQSAAPCAANQNCDRLTNSCASIVPECVGQVVGHRFCGETGSVKVCGLDLVRLETESCDGSCANGQCLLPGCGNGRVEPGEQCDDGNSSNTDLCTGLCRSPACGDGFQQAGEECDDANKVPNDLCSNTCKKPKCGDGTLQSGEECDDGNAIDNDATCTNSCKKPRCGDKLTQANEACDDGNTVDADACSNSCTVSGCGDGATQANEECDDGNKVSTDLCTAACKKPTCGDSFTQANEACDDGNTDELDGCSSACKTPGCGDNVKQAGEECDDGNTIDTDGCTALCKNPACGDRLVSLGETCDDGNSESNDGCSSQCQREECGDTITQSWEACDDGNEVETDGCTNDCKGSTCGDGAVQSASGEQCDDANENDFDDCTNDCKSLPKLSALNAQCNQSNQATRTVCIEAISKWCAVYGYSVGFAIGPAAGGLTVGCMNDVEKFSGNLDYNRDFGAECQLQQQSPGCLLKTHNACWSHDNSKQLGFFFSPSRAEVILACAPGNPQTFPASQLAGCSLSAGNFVSIECVSAVQQFCQSKGANGGMVQGLSADGAQVTVTCATVAKVGTAKF